MTPADRVRAALTGYQPDRVPFAFWYHFRYLDDPAGESLANETLKFYREYRPDILKVMHDIPYQLPDGMTQVRTPADWRALRPLDPQTGYFGRHLDALRRIIAAVGPDVPVISTVFNLFAYAERITGKRALEQFRADPEAMRAGLHAVNQSLVEWGKAVVSVGGVGLYLAVQGASSAVMPEDEYRREYLWSDIEVMTAARRAGAWLNICHLHGEALYFPLWRDIPHDVLCWSSTRTPPSLAFAREMYPGCIMAGIDEVDIETMAPAAIAAQGRSAIAAAGPLRFILAPGCAVPTGLRPAKLQAIGAAVAAA